MSRSSRPTRRVAAAPPKRRVLVFTEGEATEPIYLTHLYRQYRERVAVIIDNRHGTPLTIVRHAVAERGRCFKDERRGRGAGYDSYWCVLDVDEHPDLAEARRLAHQHGINLAVSNPCIELWFVLHTEDQRAHIDRQHIQRRSAELFGFDKHPDATTLNRFAERYPEASKSRSARQHAPPEPLTRREQPEHIDPTTHRHHLGLESRSAHPAPTGGHLKKLDKTSQQLTTRKVPALPPRCEPAMQHRSQTRRFASAHNRIT